MQTTISTHADAVVHVNTTIQSNETVPTLAVLGYDEGWAALLARRGGGRVMRVTAGYHDECEVSDGANHALASMTGRMRFLAERPGDAPVVGDWVTLEDTPGACRINGILPRRTLLKRIDDYHGEVQPMAANADIALLVQSLNADLNINRLQRYIAVAYEAGVDMVVVLTKADLCEDAERTVARIREEIVDARVVVTSSMNGAGLDELKGLLPPGTTCIALGSSGVGKSTLLNALAERELMATAAVREDDAKGRHTTRIRKMHALPWGALFIDTPGMREIAGGAVGGMFADIEALAAQCAFADCRHESEPGCAIREALASGSLPSKRYDNYFKLKGDEARLERLSRGFDKRQSKRQNQKRGIHYKDLKRGKARLYDEDY